ncbi:hypothetical protein BC830DRAFT_245080 [Chytriomyces sp. MP71]|nr:hypothetical protein BC830DRAFT_245080 [Chytriomyces sp. MP71]
MWVFTVGELSVRDLDNPSSPPPFGCPATSTTKMPEAPSEDQIIAIVARRGPLLARLFDAEHAHLPLQEQQRERRRRRFVLANRIKSLVGTALADKLDPFQLYTVSEHGLEDEADSDHVGDMSLLEQPSPAEAIPLLDMNSFLLSKPIQPLSPKLALATQAVLEPYPPVPVRKRVHGKQKSKDETAGGLGAEGGDAFIPKRHKHTDLLHKPGYQLYAFQLKAQAQPLHKLLSTAQKVVMTKDWQVSSTNMTFLNDDTA